MQNPSVYISGRLAKLRQDEFEIDLSDRGHSRGSGMSPAVSRGVDACALDVEPLQDPRETLIVARDQLTK